MNINTARTHLFTGKSQQTRLAPDQSPTLGPKDGMDWGRAAAITTGALAGAGLGLFAASASGNAAGVAGAVIGTPTVAMAGALVGAPLDLVFDSDPGMMNLGGCIGLIAGPFTGFGLAAQASGPVGMAVGTLVGAALGGLVVAGATEQRTSSGHCC